MELIDWYLLLLTLSFPRLLSLSTFFSSFLWLLTDFFYGVNLELQSLFTGWFLFWLYGLLFILCDSKEVYSSFIDVSLSFLLLFLAYLFQFILLSLLLSYASLYLFKALSSYYCFFIICFNSNCFFFYPIREPG